MKPLFQLLIQVILTLTLTLCRKDGDEGRPYEFGFTIEGQQHRHEKKDENGIIQGEFGFITADGIYHVTVYATDENGNFKILSMKNIRISAPLDGSAATGPISPEANKYLKSPKASESPPVQSSSRPQPLQSQRLVQPNPIQEVVAATPKPQLVFTTKPTIKPACGGCGYVTTQKPTSRPQIENQVILQSHPIGGSLQSTNTANQAPPDVELLPPGFRTDNVGPSTNFQPSTHVPSDEYQQLSGQMQNAGNQGDVVYRQQQTPNAQSITSVSGTPSTDLLAPHLDISYNKYKQDSGHIQYPGNQQEAVYEQQQNQYSQPLSQVNNNVFTSVNQKQVANIQTDHLASLGNQTNQKEYVEIVANLPETAKIPNLADRFNQLNLPPTSNEASKLPPITVSDNSIHVGGRQTQDIPIQDKFPGMVDGLPDGIEEKDITNILYKFKYTVGFHGHYETGLKDGTKIGGYFVNGRDGFSRVVTYVADENGYRPKFKLVNLGLDSPDTPKEDTEKTFGLKSFEFVWYPIN